MQNIKQQKESKLFIKKDQQSFSNSPKQGGYFLEDKKQNHINNMNLSQLTKQQLHIVQTKFKYQPSAKIKTESTNHHFTQEDATNFSSNFHNRSNSSKMSILNSPYRSNFSSPLSMREKAMSSELQHDFVLDQNDEVHEYKISQPRFQQSNIEHKRNVYGTSVITEQLSQTSQQQFFFLNKSLDKRLVVNYSQQDIFSPLLTLKEKEKSQHQNLPRHSYLQNNKPTKMMLFKDTKEYFKLECKGKQFPLRISCTNLSAPFSIAISTKNKYPTNSPNGHEYLLHFEQTGSKKMEFQFLQGYNRDQFNTMTLPQRGNITLPSFDFKKSNNNRLQVAEHSGVDCIYFSFYCEQLTSFTITTQFEDDITIKYITDDMFKPQKMIPQKYVTKMQQVQKDNQFNPASIEKLNREVVQIIKRRKEQRLKNAKNIDMVELNKMRAKNFLDLEYEKFINKVTHEFKQIQKVNKVQDKQRQKVKQTYEMKGEEKQEEKILKIQIRDLVKQKIAETREHHNKLQQLQKFRKRWIQIITLNKLIQVITRTIRKHQLVKKFYRKEKMQAIKLIEKYRKNVSLTHMNFIQRTLAYAKCSSELVAKQVKQFAYERAVEILKIAISNKDSFKILTQLFQKSKIYYTKCVKIQKFVHGQYSKEKQTVMELLDSIITEIRVFRKSNTKGDGVSSPKSTLNSPLTPSVASPYYYFLQYLTMDIKNKICKEFISQRKVLFKQQLKKYKEIITEFQVKMESHKAKLLQREQQKNNQNMLSPLTTSRNWSNVRRISIAVSFFVGDLHKKIKEVDKGQKELNSPRIKVSSPSNANQQANIPSPLQNRKPSSLFIPKIQVNDCSANSPQSTKSKRGLSNFNTAFQNFENAAQNSTSSQNLSVLSLTKQRSSQRQSNFVPTNYIVEDNIQEPRLVAKRPRLNLQARKELEDILFVYLNQFKEKSM